MDQAKNALKKEDIVTIKITVVAMCVYLIGQLIRLPEVIALSMVFFEAFIGSKMCIWLSGDWCYGFEKKSTICCGIYNLYFYTATFIIEFVSNHRSPLRSLMITVIIQLIFIAIGYSATKKTVYDRWYYTNFGGQYYNSSYEEYDYQEETKSENNNRSKDKSSSKTVHDYFDGCHTERELKKRYRDLSKIYHPDNNETGDEELFKIINQQYQERREQMAA